MRKLFIFTILLGTIFSFANPLSEAMVKIGDKALLSNDYNHAIANYKAACFVGNAKGCLKAGICYIQGWGVKSNREIAKKFYERACYLGNKDGCNAFFNLNKCNIIWQKRLFSNSDLSRIDSIIKIKDGFLISGGINTNGFIAKIDNNGKIIWKKIINTKGEGVFGDKYKLIKIYNQLYILALPSGGNQMSLFASIDKNGNVIRKEDLDFIPTSYNMNKGNIFIGGFEFSQKYNNLVNTLEMFNIFLSSGKIWERTYPQKNDSWIEDILITNNNIYLIDDLGNLIKLNKNGRIIEKKHIFLEGEKFAIKIDKNNFLLIYKNTNKIEKISFDGRNKLLVNLNIPSFIITQLNSANGKIILGGDIENSNNVFIAILDNKLNIKYIKFLHTKGILSALGVNNNSIILGIERNQQAILMKIK